ncbi:MAG: tetratricopeptide repeat protein [Candidatus Omnitrophica bacterium]|nr:tetratricopeptide repeat protein [Candidatus Omnitrophota bacterium]
MNISLLSLTGHCICSVLFVLFARYLKITKAWVSFFVFLFFISQPSVFLVWGPFRFIGLYVASFVFFFLLAAMTPRFYCFLKSQEMIVRVLFWMGIGVFGCFIIWSSIFEISVRQSAVTFWTYEAKRHPFAENFNNLGDAYKKRGDFTAANTFYQQAAMKDQHSIRAYEGMALLAKEQKQWDKAIPLLEKMIEINPQLPEAYLDLGEAFRMLGKPQEAVSTYSRLLTMFPDDEKIDIALVQAYGRAIVDNPSNVLYKEKREEVLADFEQLSKRKKYNAADYYNLALLYEQVGGKEEAIRFYAKALQIDPNHEGALHNLANLYRDTGNLKIALRVYERLVHLHPKNVSGYLNQGLIWNALGDKLKARQFYLKVIDLAPDNASAYFNLGYLSESQGELRESINYYEKAVEVDPKNAEAYYNLGNVYANLGQNAEAIAAYLKTVVINHRHQDAYVNLSILSFKSRDFKEAIHYLAEAQSLGYNPPVEYLKTLEPYRDKY